MKERRKVVPTPSKLLSSGEVCGLEHSLLEQVDSSSHRLRSGFFWEHPRKNQMPRGQAIVTKDVCTLAAVICKGSLRACFLEFRIFRPLSLAPQS